MKHIPELTTELPQLVKINGQLYSVQSIGQQNYASILRGQATEIDPSIRFTFVPVEEKIGG